jgi:hypothetical protein
MEKIKDKSDSLVNDVSVNDPPVIKKRFRKTKKAIKWSVYSILLITVITYLTCYINFLMKTAEQTNETTIIHGTNNNSIVSFTYSKITNHFLMKKITLKHTSISNSNSSKAEAFYEYLIIESFFGNNVEAGAKNENGFSVMSFRKEKYERELWPEREEDFKSLDSIASSIRRKITGDQPKLKPSKEEQNKKTKKPNIY